MTMRMIFNLFESSLCESGTLEVLHRPDLVCQFLTLATKYSSTGNKIFINWQQIIKKDWQRKIFFRKILLTIAINFYTKNSQADLLPLHRRVTVFRESLERLLVFPQVNLGACNREDGHEKDVDICTCRYTITP